MSQKATATTTAIPLEPIRRPAPPSPSYNVEGYSSQEDDAPTRVRTSTKRATYSQGPDALPPLGRATTRERETEREVDDERGRYCSYYVRDFGDRISPNFNDVQHQAGLRVDSTLTDKSQVSTTATSVSPKVTVMDVMHNWTQEVRDDEFVATINYMVSKSAESTEPEGRIVWVHVHDDLPSLDKLEKFFKSHLANRVQQFIGETTVSLLNRVRSTRERKLVSGSLGKFLLPDVTRYSARSSQTASEDHPCLFLSFPYLALGNFVQSAESSIFKPRSKHVSPTNPIAIRNRDLHSSLNSCDDPESQRSDGLKNPVNTKYDEINDSSADQYPQKQYHPTRTLLQSRYRLESTQKRDKKQAILSLTNKEIRDCISRPSSADNLSSNVPDMATANHSPQPVVSNEAKRNWLWSSKKQKREKLYIPQLWSLSLSGDVMLTCGPIHVNDLCGSALVRRTFEPTSSKLKHSIVRFIVHNEDGRQDSDIFLYPAESCEWYFGLINKQRKVEKHLGTQTPKQAKPNIQTPNNAHYAIIYRKNADDDGQTVDCNNWLQIQSEHNGQHLDLYLEYIQSPSININGLSIDTGRRGVIKRSVSHERSTSEPAISTTPTSPRYLMTPQLGETRMRSFSSSTRSASPASASNATWPETYTTFFEWCFLEEVTQNIHMSRRRTGDERTNVWLAKVHKFIHTSHGKDMDTTLKPPTDSTASINHTERLQKRIVGTKMQIVHQKYFTPGGSATVADASEITSKEAQRIFGKAKQFLKLFVSKDYWEPGPAKAQDALMIQVYWGLIDRILEGILVEHKLEGSDMRDLSQILQDFVELGKQTHRGVWQMKGDKTDPYDVATVSSAVIYTPLADALQHICDLFFDVIWFMEQKDSTQHATGSVLLKPTIEKSIIRVQQDFKIAQKFLISGGDENRYQKSLGPVVTPEGIMILLLRRLSKGVYKDGAVNVIEIFERIIERLAIKVEESSSRFLLLEINRIAEEIDIILSHFRDQRDFLGNYRDYLDPKIIENPTMKRMTRFDYEQHGIERIINEVSERIKDCEELKEHVARLANQNLQLVEGGQDDINKKLMLFTVVTIIFLPASFVTGFLGMNLVGVEETTYTTSHFWIIATPLTGGLLTITLLTLYWNYVTLLGRKLRDWAVPDNLDDD